MENIWKNESLIDVLTGGGVVVMPTDTIYGIVGQALKKETVERIYRIKRRNPEKPCIVLIGGIENLKNFSIELSEKQKKVLERYWPGPVSVVLDCDNNKFEYLARGTKTLAFRLSNEVDLQNLLKKVGPLVAPSANLEGALPSEDIVQAKEYFGDLVDLYIGGRKKIDGKASKLLQLHKDGSVSILRE